MSAWWQYDYHWNDVNRIVTPLNINKPYDSGVVKLEDPIFPNMENQFKIMKTRNNVRIAVPIMMTLQEQALFEHQFTTYGAKKCNYVLLNDTYVPAFMTPDQKAALPYIAS